MKKIMTAIFTIIIINSLLANVLEPFSKRISVTPKGYKDSQRIKVPLITWGADIVTIYANGGKNTNRNSIFAGKGLNIELFREDDFKRQLEMYLKGETPFLRGTMGMINMAADVTELDARTKLVVVYQHSWSAGGDALVVKSGIKSVASLRGKTIVIQKYGPHVDYLMKLLKDANLTLRDVNLIWTNDLVGPDGDTPMAKLYKSNVHAAFVIIPDALALTSNGTIGTGAEDSVKGAKILLSTKTANRIINDVYAVRKDYFDKNKSKVQKFVHALFIAEEQIKDIFKNKSQKKYKQAITSAANVIFDTPDAASEIGAMYYDAHMAGFKGNIKFFTDTHYLRNFSKLTNEIQGSLIQLGVLKSKKTLLQANWNYNNLKSELKYAKGVDASVFNKDAVSTIITKKQKQDTLDEGELFSFEIFFKPNQNTFPSSLYKNQFNKVINFSATYGGAIITVEGHSDPMGYLRKKKNGNPQVILSKIKQAAKNLSLSRANAVRNEIINYAVGRGITLDKSQFVTIGYGITKPKYSIPKTNQQWMDNMRVQFKIIQIEAEENVFVPLDG